jgi:hypothetical protein
MSEHENDPIEQVMSKVTHSEVVTRNLGGLFSQAGFLLNTVSRQIASRGRVLEAEMRLAAAKAQAGEPVSEPGLLGTVTATLFAGVQGVSEELATHRALVFKRVIDLLAVGRGRSAVREYLAERRWAEVEDPTAQEATARELILSTPGMEGFIKSQVELDALWIGLMFSEDYEPPSSQKQTRKRKKKAD